MNPQALPEGTRRHLPPPHCAPRPATDWGPALMARARALGFARVGFAPTTRMTEAATHVDGWLADGLHGVMRYLEGPTDRADPRGLLADAKSAIVVALPYAARDDVALRSSREGAALTGVVARYARGEDYHRVMRDKLIALGDACAELAGRPVLARSCVDTAPLLERELAARAGIGFVAKSTMLLAPGLGTCFLLGELLVDLELPPSAPVEAGCGACRACLDACPTGAFIDAHRLDARRCISYLTIELSGPIPRELRAAIGNRVFGCDVCQDVCPHNASPQPRPRAPELAPRPNLDAVDLITLLQLGSAAHKKLVRRTALRRSSRQSLRRNAAIALGNSGDPRAVAPLVSVLRDDRDPLIRAHAAWALGRLGGVVARAALQQAARADTDAGVREEAAESLEDP